MVYIFLFSYLFHIGIWDYFIVPHNKGKLCTNKSTQRKNKIGK